MAKVFNEQQLNTILTSLEKNKNNHTKTAAQLKISEQEVVEVDVVENKRYNYTEHGNGPENMQKYLIGKLDLRKGIVWDNTQPKIRDARKLYDQGKIEMCTGRDGFFMLLYAIPRQVQVRRNHWFKDGVAA